MYAAEALCTAISLQHMPDDEGYEVGPSGKFTGSATTRDGGNQLKDRNMGFTATAGSGQAFRRVPAGVHVARCISVIDLGTQDVTWEGTTKLQHKIQITWEVLGDDENGVPMTMEVDGQELPMTISKRYTLSLSNKARMRGDLEAWRGKAFTDEELKGFDVSKLLGAYCMLNVTETESNGKTYANVSSITPLPRAIPKPAGVHPLVMFDLDKPDMKVFESFYDKLKEVIQQSQEWQARTAKMTGQPAQASKPKAEPESLIDMADDVPF
jgi:hypothetical protein